MTKYLEVRVVRTGKGSPLYKAVEAKPFGVEVKAAKPPEKVEEVAEQPASPQQALTTFAGAHEAFRVSMMSFVIAAERYMAMMLMIPSVEVDTFLIPQLRKEAEVVNDDGECITFKLDSRKYHILSEFGREQATTDRFIQLLPDHLLAGLISQYDVFIARTIEAAFDKKRELAKTIEKKFSYAELLDYETIDEVRAAVVDREVEALLYRSHSDHLEWFKQRGVDVRKNFDRLPEFFEICERRNVIVHNEGLANNRYVKKCSEFDVETDGVQVGSRLAVKPKYFRRAVGVVVEVGVRLGALTWQKFDKEEQDSACKLLRDMSYDLIRFGRFPLAIRLMEFGLSELNWPVEMTKLMTIVNLANAHRLNENPSKAEESLSKVDWNTKSDMFRVSVAAVKGDTDECVAAMRRIGAKGDVSADEYRVWPVFSKTRDDPKFQEVFEEIFGESLWAKTAPQSSN